MGIVRRSLPLLTAVLLPVVVFLGVIATGYDGVGALRGDCPYYVATARSLFEDHDLDLSNQLWQPWKVHHTDISFDLEGRFVPKHPLWMPISALPLILTFGDDGALIFNVLQLSILLGLMFVLAQRVAPPWPAAVACCLTVLGSFLPHYALNFSPDVFTAVLFFGALTCLPADRSTAVGRHVVAGVLLGFAATAKPIFGLTVIVFPLLTGKPWRRSLSALALGIALPAALWLCLNHHLFGHPLTTAYDRIVHFTPNGIEVHSHREDFSLKFWEGAKGQLLMPSKGLAPTSPITILALGLLPLLWRDHRRWGWFVTLAATAFYLFYSAYSLWPTSHWGNRFLIPVVALGVLPLAAAVARLPSFSRKSPTRCRPEPNRPQPSAAP